MTSEGPYTKAGVAIAMVALVGGYLLTAGENSWWPFAADRSAGEEIVRDSVDPQTPDPDEPQSRIPTGVPVVTTTKIAPDTVYWSGTISLDEYAEVNSSRLRDLDSAPPTTDADEGDVGAGDIESSSPEYTFGYLVSRGGDLTIAAWSGAAAPTRRQCREASVAAGSATVEMRLGDHACLRTSHGRTAALQITKLIGDQSLRAKVTVWDDGEF